MFTVRKYNEKYLPEIMKIEKESYGKISNWEQILNALYYLNGSNFSFVCVDQDDKVVGYSISISYHHPTLYLMDVCVSANYRKLGIAKTLISETLSKLKKDFCLIEGHFNYKSSNLMSTFKDIKLVKNISIPNFHGDNKTSYYRLYEKQ